MPDKNPLNESRALEEYWALHTDPIFQGSGVEHGNGEAILLIPGLFANDLYMHTANTWLRRIGYRPITSQILWNVGCPRRLLDTLTNTVQAQVATGQPFYVIGHSRGGLLAKALASRFSEQVHKVVVVGSPLAGMLAAGKSGLQQYANFMQQDNATIGRQFVFNAGRAMTQLIDPDCKSPACDCQYTDDLFAPISAGVELTSIYSLSDPIVPAASSVLPGATNIAIDGSHSGLMFNKAVYPHLAHALAP